MIGHFHRSKENSPVGVNGWEVFGAVNAISKYYKDSQTEVIGYVCGMPDGDYEVYNKSGKSLANQPDLHHAILSLFVK